MSTPKPKLKVKIVMLGKTMVGKTSITCRIAYGHCNEETYATVGATFVMGTRGRIKYDMWDTGGQERFRCLMPMYIRDSKIIIFVFDTTNISTFDTLNDYKSDLGVLKNYHIIVVGNKIDMLDDEQLTDIVNLTKSKLESSPLKEKIYDCVLVSAKTGENFDNFLELLYNCAKLYKHDEKENTQNMLLDKLSEESMQRTQYTQPEEIDKCSC